MAEKVFPIVRPAHFFFLALRSGNAWRSNPTCIHCKKYIQNMILYMIRNKMAEKVGFEPTWACALTVFKTAPL